MPEGYHCDCGCHEFRKETDILDVWLDSGVSWAAVLKDRGLDFPADVYSEGSDQHRGWFQSSYIPSFTLEGTAPFKTILTHGMVLDQQGRPMHKSLGNSVDPEDVINKYGADILRLWVSFADYQGDVRISDEILGGPIDTYRKIRNTVRYALGNLSDYDPALHQVPGKELAEMDRYMLGRLDALIQEVHAGYEEFNFRRAMRAITDFCILDLSSFMLDASKDRLYTLGASSPARRSAQTVLAEIAVTLLQLMAPVLSFTAEEAWQELRKTALGRELPQSIFLSNMPANASLIPDVKLEEKWNKIRRVRETVQKVLEDARQKGVIGSSLEATCGRKLPLSLRWKLRTEQMNCPYLASTPPDINAPAVGNGRKMSVPIRNMPTCAPAVPKCLKKSISKWTARKKPMLKGLKTALAWCGQNKAVLWGVAGILFLDRVTKVLALYLLPENPLELCPFFHLRYVENTGAAFGMMQNGNFALIFVMLAVIAYMVFSWKDLTSHGKLVKWGAVFILAGALGNLYDRITLGFVVDFLDFRVWPVFNVADSFITIGACLFVLSLFFHATKREAK